MTSGQWVRRKRVATGVTVLIMLLLGTIMGLTLEHSIATAKRSTAQALAYNHAERILQRVQDAVGPAFMLASLIQQGNGQINDFERVAEDLLQSFPMVRALELAPGGVVAKVYPLQGNEKIIGHDLLRDRDRNREAHVAVARRQMTIAGPFNLLQGGMGAVGRYPVFLPDRSGRDSFWGFAIVLIRIPELLNSAGVLELTREGYRYELCRVIPEGNECQVFARSSEGASLRMPVTVPVDVPNGNWQLSLSPEAGWVSFQERMLIIVAVVLVASLVGGLQYFFLRGLQRES